MEPSSAVEIDLPNIAESQMENDSGQIWRGAQDGGTSKADDVLAQKKAERKADAILPDQSEQIAALRAEIERLTESVRQVAAGTSEIATAEFKELAAAAERKLKQNVFVSVGVAAALGYLWGRSGR
jgi:ElaB/YqjD/DUF883 family membrane-anchored ribosome-binding protein